MEKMQDWKIWLTRKTFQRPTEKFVLTKRYTYPSVSCWLEELDMFLNPSAEEISKMSPVKKLKALTRKSSDANTKTSTPSTSRTFKATNFAESPPIRGASTEGSGMRLRAKRNSILTKPAGDQSSRQKHFRTSTPVQKSRMKNFQKRKMKTSTPLSLKIKPFNQVLSTN